MDGRDPPQPPPIGEAYPQRAVGEPPPEQVRIDVSDAGGVAQRPGERIPEGPLHLIDEAETGSQGVERHAETADAGGVRPR